MIKKSSQLVGKPVLLQREKAIVGSVHSLVVNPDNGELVGILVVEGFGSRKLRSLSARDIIAIKDGYFMINSYDSLGDIDEIVRIKEVLDKDVIIRKCRVYTVSGKFLGKVKDFTINLKTMFLEKIIVDSLWTLSTKRHYLIALNQIISIEDGKIVVADATIENLATVSAEISEAI